MIYDKTYGYASYGCALCCGYKPPTCKLDPLGIPLPGNAQNGIFSLDTCSMKVEDVSGSFDSWTVVDPTIATTNSTGYHTSVAVGSTFSNTAGDLPFYRNQCDLVTYYPKCAANVPPTVTIDSFSPNPIGGWRSRRMSAGWAPHPFDFQRVRFVPELFTSHQPLVYPERSRRATEFFP